VEGTNEASKRQAIAVALLTPLEVLQGREKPELLREVPRGSPAPAVPLTPAYAGGSVAAAGRPA
jgi:hypothetical protein